MLIVNDSVLLRYLPDVDRYGNPTSSKAIIYADLTVNYLEFLSTVAAIVWLFKNNGYTRLAFKIGVIFSFLVGFADCIICVI